MISAPTPLSSSQAEDGPVLLLIYTGGTFAMHLNKGGTLVPTRVNNLFKHIPAYKHLCIHLHICSLKQPIDSVDMQPLHWQALAKHIIKYQTTYAGFVLIHGTDTMAYTATALSYLLVGLKKPVILTGAQIPISYPRSDAPSNLLGALEVAAARDKNEPQVQEVAIFFGGHLLRGNRAIKHSSSDLCPFHSPNYPLLGEAKRQLIFHRSALLRPKQPAQNLLDCPKMEEKVGILHIFPGISFDWLQSMLATKMLRGLLLCTYGTGTPTSDAWLRKSLQTAISQGLIILNISQCLHGSVVPNKYLPSRKFSQIGVIQGKDMTLEAALIKLMFCLGQENNRDIISQNITMPLAGEVSTQRIEDN